MSAVARTVKTLDEILVPPTPPAPETPPAPPVPPVPPAPETPPAPPAPPAPPVPTPPVPPAPPEIPTVPQLDPTTQLLAALTAQKTPSQTPPPTPVDPRVEAVEFLEKTGKVSAGTKAEYEAYTVAESAYRAKWESENPGEEFDITASEHSKFVRTKYPKSLRPELVDRAEIELSVEKRAEEKVDQLRRQLALERASMQAQTVVAGAVSELDSGTKDDPLLKHFVDQVKPATAAFAQEAVLLFSGVRPPDMSNPQHQALLAVVSQAEPGISRTGITDQYGRRAVSQAEYARIPDTHRNQFVPLQAAPDVVAKLVVSQMRQQAEQQANQIRPLVAPPAPPPPPVPPPVPPPSTPPTPLVPGAPPSPSYVRKFSLHPK